MGDKWAPPPAEWTGTVNEKKEANVAKMRPRLQNNNVPMDYHGALGALRRIIAERPDVILVNEGANTLDFARSIIDMYKPRKRLDVGTWSSEEHTSELQSLMRISYAVFCLKKKKNII